MTDLLPAVTELPADPLMVIEVTESHIEEGIPGDASHCAIAMALRGHGFHSPGVAGSVMTWEAGDGENWARLPEEAQHFIGVFDAWGEDNHQENCNDDDCERCYWPEAPEPITFSVEPHAGLPPAGH